MKHTTKVVIVALFTLLTAANVNAGEVYGKFTFGQARGDMGDFVITPTHPTSVDYSRGDDSDGAESLSVGYRSDTGYYAEAGYANLGKLSKFRNASGADTTFGYQTTINRSEDVNALYVAAGKSFQLSELVSAFGHVGAHRYERKVSESRNTQQYDLVSPISSVTTNESFSVLETDVDGLAGLGVEFGSRTVRASLGVTRYAGVNRTVVAAGLSIGLK